MVFRRGKKDAAAGSATDSKQLRMQVDTALAGVLQSYNTAAYQSESLIGDATTFLDAMVRKLEEGPTQQGSASKNSISMEAIAKQLETVTDNAERARILKEYASAQQNISAVSSSEELLQHFKQLQEILVNPSKEASEKIAAMFSAFIEISNRGDASLLRSAASLEPQGFFSRLGVMAVPSMALLRQKEGANPALDDLFRKLEDLFESFKVNVTDMDMVKWRADNAEKLRTALMFLSHLIKQGSVLSKADAGVVAQKIKIIDNCLSSLPADFTAASQAAPSLEEKARPAPVAPPRPKQPPAVVPRKPQQPPSGVLPVTPLEGEATVTRRTLPPPPVPSSKPASPSSLSSSGSSGLGSSVDSDAEPQQSQPSQPKPAPRPQQTAAHKKQPIPAPRSRPRDFLGAMPEPAQSGSSDPTNEKQPERPTPAPRRKG